MTQHLHRVTNLHRPFEVANRPCEFSSFYALVRFASAQLASSPPFPLPGSAYPLTDVTTPCHASFPLNQDELVAFASSSSNPSSHRIASRAKTEVLNLHHHSRSPSPNHLTPTLHCYKKIISTVATLLAHHSTTPPFCLLPSETTTSSELHPSPSFPFTIVPHQSSLDTMTLTLMN
jgi:hypothetical protein